MLLQAAVIVAVIGAAMFAVKLALGTGNEKMWLYKLVGWGAAYIAFPAAIFVSIWLANLISRIKSKARGVELTDPEFGGLGPELLDDDLARDASSERPPSARNFIGGE